LGRGARALLRDHWDAAWDVVLLPRDRPHRHRPGLACLPAARAAGLGAGGAVMTRHWWKKLWLAVAAVAVLQTAALGWMVYERVRLLQTGREAVLPIVPVDPRSLFRGDYVRLSYDVTRVPGRLIKGDVSRGEWLYVTIQRQED